MDDKELEQILAEIREKAGITSKPVESVAPPKPSKSSFSFEEKPLEAPKPKTVQHVQSGELAPVSDTEKKDTPFEISQKEQDDFLAPPVRNTRQEETLSENEENEDEEVFDDGGIKEAGDSLKKGIIVALVVVIVLALGVGIYFGFFHGKGGKETTVPKTTAEQTTAAAEVVGTLNPLTGESGYNEKAIGKRPVAVVVENEYSAESVRPQWGINDADIVMEAETEFSTRMLFFWADYTKMPEKIGPTRSARPPFIRFSELFDGIFIHAGLSHSKGSYEGADSVFDNDKVDHINLLNLDESGNFFGRDSSRGGAMEHTGYLNGNNTEALLEKKGINTNLDSAKFSQLKFNKKVKPLSKNNADKIIFIWSDPKNNGHCPKAGKFEYLAEEKKYTTYDFDSSNGDADVKFQNLIFLLDETEYIVKENYKTAGNSETYCNYKLSGGKGTVVSQGTYININWSIENGKLVLKDENGKEVKLNPGKSYIGYGSSNKGGKVTVNPTDE